MITFLKGNLTFRENDCINCCDLALAQFDIGPEERGSCIDEGCKTNGILDGSCSDLFNGAEELSSRNGCVIGRDFRYLSVSKLVSSENDISFTQCRRNENNQIELNQNLDEFLDVAVEGNIEAVISVQDCIRCSQELQQITEEILQNEQDLLVTNFVDFEVLEVSISFSSSLLLSSSLFSPFDS